MDSFLPGNSERKLIVVTGPPRSGTTAVGKIMSMAPHACSLHEPMNFETGDECVGEYFCVPGKNGFTQSDYADLVNRVAELKLTMKSGVFTGDSALKRVGKLIGGSRSVRSHYHCKLRMNIKTIIWKDPFFLFTLEHFFKLRSDPVVVCYRSPYALAASFKRTKWTFDAFEIERKMGGSYIRERSIALGNFENHRPVNRAAWLWLYTYRYVVEMIECGYPIILLDLDKVVTNPKETYRELFECVGLRYSRRVDRQLERTFSESNLKKADIPENKTHSKNRNLKKISEYWQGTLNQGEIAAVESICGEYVGIIRNILSVPLRP